MSDQIAGSIRGFGPFPRTRVGLQIGGIDTDVGRDGTCFYRDKGQVWTMGENDQFSDLRNRSRVIKDLITWAIGFLIRFKTGLG